VKLRCYLESLLRMHRPDCEHCNPRVERGPEIRKRLEELNLRMQPRSVHSEEHEEVVRVFDSKSDEGVGSPPISSVQQKKIV
jgi:hypothetical protein